MVGQRIGGGRTPWVALLAGSLILAGCGGMEGKEIVEPHLSADGKVDVTKEINMRRARLEFGGTVSGTLKNDLQFDGYTFRAVAGTVVTIDTVAQQTEAGLDNVLFLYGPRVDTTQASYYRSPALVFDDDSGSEDLARISSLTIPKDGTYLVVTGSPLGLDKSQSRGTYALQLLCDSGDCEEPQDPRLMTCDSDVQEWISYCVSDLVPLGTAVTLADIATCTTEDQHVQNYYAIACDEQDGFGLSWCDATYEEFKEIMMPACARQVAKAEGLAQTTPEADPALQTCDSNVREWIGYCLPLNYTDADLEDCTSEEKAADYFNLACNSDEIDARAFSWCDGSVTAQQFTEQMMPACAESLANTQ